VNSPPSEVPYGTLDLMVLKTLQVMGPLHGYGIARRSETNRRARFYSITRAGRKQLAAEAETWARTVAMVNRLLEE